MTYTDGYLPQEARRDIAADIAAWEAEGNEIQRIERGVCNWDALSNRAKINPTVRLDEVQARRQATASHPHPNMKPARKPRADRVKRGPKKPGPDFARPGSGKRRVLDALSGNWASVADLAVAASISKSNVREYLRILAKHGLVEAGGGYLQRRWRRVDGEPAPPLPDERRPRVDKGVPKSELTPPAKAMLALVPLHPTVPLLVQASGKPRKEVWAMLNRLRARGLVAFDGEPGVLGRWTVTSAADR